MFCFHVLKAVNHIIMWINELHCLNQGFLGKSFWKMHILLHIVIAWSRLLAAWETYRCCCWNYNLLRWVTSSGCVIDCRIWFWLSCCKSCRFPWFRFMLVISLASWPLFLWRFPLHILVVVSRPCTAKWKSYYYKRAMLEHCFAFGEWQTQCQNLCCDISSIIVTWL